MQKVRERSHVEWSSFFSLYTVRQIVWNSAAFYVKIGRVTVGIMEEWFTEVDCCEAISHYFFMHKRLRKLCFFTIVRRTTRSGYQPQPLIYFPR